MRWAIEEVGAPICNVCKWKYVERGDVCPECAAREALANEAADASGAPEEIEYEVKKLVAERFHRMLMATIAFPLCGYVAAVKGILDLRRMKRLGYAGIERTCTRVVVAFAAVCAVGITLAAIAWRF